jgi:hypothetical protein
VARLTFGILDSYVLCGILHTQELPLIAGLLAISHSVAGINMMIRKVWGKQPLAEALVVALGLLVTLQVVLSYYM